MRLAVFANSNRPERVRVGVGQHNKPETRARLILGKLLDEIKEMTLHCSSTICIETEWLAQIHDLQYLDFLEGAYASWKQEDDVDWKDASGGLVPNHILRSRPLKSVPPYKHSGFYGSDQMTPIYEDTFQNAMLAASQAYRAAENAMTVGGVSYALTCSPGHHAQTKTYGGYCFLNNAAIAAFHIATKKNVKVGILDVDYHSGSTTIVDENPTLHKHIVVCSIHGDPRYEYPSFEGYKEQNNERIHNVPLAGGSKWEVYAEALQEAIEFLIEAKVGALVIAFGADTYKEDPDVSEANRISLVLGDYLKMGSMIKRSFRDMPIVVTQEGGYSMDMVGPIVCEFLQGLLS